MPAALPTQHADAIQTLAFHLAHTRAHVTTAEAALQDAKQALAQIAGRIAEKEAEKAPILARRAAGQALADDAGAFGLLAADIEGLVAEAQAAQAQVDRAMVPLAGARNAEAAARQGLDRATMEAEEAALTGWLAETDAVLGEALNRLKALHSALGRGRPAWAPSHETITELRRLRLAVGGMA